MALYQLSIDGGAFSTVDNLAWNTVYRYDSSLRPDNATSTLSVTYNDYREPTSSTHGNNGEIEFCEPFDPKFSTPTDVGKYCKISLQKICDGQSGATSIFTNKKAKIVTSTNNNSLDPSSARLRTRIVEYEIYEENYLFPDQDRTSDQPLNTIKNVSSLNYNFNFATGDDYGSYEDDFEGDSNFSTVTDPMVLDKTDGNDGDSSSIKIEMSAVGINTDGGDKLSNADSALDKIEDFTADYVGRLALNGLPYDITITTRSDDSSGSVSKIITYTKYPDTASYRDSYNVIINQDTRNPDSYTSVSIQGKIQGLNTAASITNPMEDNRDSNADTGWGVTQTKLYDRAKKALSTVNVVPISKQYSYEDQGIINYNYTYDTRPLSLVSGALSETLTMSDSYQKKQVSHIPIIGGIVLQNLGTYDLPSRTVTYTARFLRGYVIPSNIETMMENAIEQFDPKKIDTSTSSFIDSIVDNEESSMDHISNTITMTKKWTYFIKE